MDKEREERKVRLKAEMREGLVFLSILDPISSSLRS